MTEQYTEFNMVYNIKVDIKYRLQRYKSEPVIKVDSIYVNGYRTTGDNLENSRVITKLKKKLKNKF